MACFGIPNSLPSKHFFPSHFQRHEDLLLSPSKPPLREGVAERAGVHHARLSDVRQRVKVAGAGSANALNEFYLFPGDRLKGDALSRTRGGPFAPGGGLGGGGSAPWPLLRSGITGGAVGGGGGVRWVDRGGRPGRVRRRCGMSVRDWRVVVAAPQEPT